MTAALIALAIGAAVVIVAALVFWAVRRSARRADERVASVVADMNVRMEGMIRELGDALERVQEEDRRTRVLGDLAASVDLDDVLSRTLEAACQFDGVDAALVRVAILDDEPVVATLGLSSEEGQRHAVTGPPDGRDVRSIAISYRYGPGQSSDAAIHAGVAVPLRADGGVTGYLAVFTRSPARTFDERDVSELEDLALRAAPAIENARRLRELRELADHDALTGLHNQRFFHETLAREVARAGRYGRSLALIVLDLDDFKQVNDRLGHLAGDDVLADIGRRLGDVIRSADIACRVGGEEFAVILPESRRADAEQLYARLENSLASRAEARVGRLTLSAGVAELRPNEDAKDLFQRADDALYRA
ncbi:MAG: sensor domain-containing diguanylate cyclase, partial [Actinomycetota bacterium]|nr:sensor domain-containing diguanylate cyclase [Actinomycetota bacterium]